MVPVVDAVRIDVSEADRQRLETDPQGTSRTVVTGRGRGLGEFGVGGPARALSDLRQRRHTPEDPDRLMSQSGLLLAAPAGSRNRPGSWQRLETRGKHGQVGGATAGRAKNRR